MNRYPVFFLLALLLVGCTARITIASPTPAQTALEQDIDAWKVSVEGDATYALSSVQLPSLGGQALQCATLGGKSYSNIQCYRVLPFEPNNQTYVLDLSFQFSPQTTYNNQGGESIVQAIEFAINRWSAGHLYRLGIQWENVGTLGEPAPQWRYWGPQQTGSSPWVPINGTSGSKLQSDQWHHLRLEGTIRDKGTTYRSFTIDDQTIPLKGTAHPILLADSSDALTVSLQLDGNARQVPFNVIVHQVNFSAYP